MDYNKKSVVDIDVNGKKVLLRCDFNVPMAKDGSGVITDDKRIRAALPTIQYLLDNNAAVIACSHMGKPKGEWKPELSMAPVAARLSELLGKEVILAKDIIGDDAKAKAAALQPGQLLLLENLRYDKGETKNDPDFAKALADLAGEGGVYVSDAFGTVHRAHASTAGVAAYLPAVSGFLIQKELEIIGGALRLRSVRWSQSWAAPRFRPRSASSTTCWKSPTPSSSAAAWRTPSPRRRAARSATPCWRKTGRAMRSR